jgi:transcriptional regulator EpsA
MLSGLERNFILSTIEKCHYSTTTEHLEEIVTYFLGSFIPHKMTVCAIGNIETKQHLRRIDFGCPHGMMDDMPPTFCMKNNFLLPLWKQQRTPLYTTIVALDEDQLSPDQKEWCERLAGNGVHNVAMHGVLDVAGGIASFFYLGTLSEPLTEHQAEIFSMLVPHLHHVLLKVIQVNPATIPKGEYAAMPIDIQSKQNKRPERQVCALTRRESEILKWIYHGKTNSETARILGISELTVRNHVQNLLLKLGVGNRTQAVVKAMQNNILSDCDASLLEQQ